MEYRVYRRKDDEMEGQRTYRRREGGMEENEVLKKEMWMNRKELGCMEEIRMMK